MIEKFHFVHFVLLQIQNNFFAANIKGGITNQNSLLFSRFNATHLRRGRIFTFRVNTVGVSGLYSYNSIWLNEVQKMMRG